MARGFDSKSVADQQEEMMRARDHEVRPAPAVSSRRRSYELARRDVLSRLEKAPEHGRESLRVALAELDDLLSRA